MAAAQVIKSYQKINFLLIFCDMTKSERLKYCQIVNRICSAIFCLLKDLNYENYPT